MTVFLGKVFRRKTLTDALIHNMRMASADTAPAVPFVDLWNDVAAQDMEWLHKAGYGGVHRA